jgi:hypothetical protein
MMVPQNSRMPVLLELDAAHAAPGRPAGDVHLEDDRPATLRLDVGVADGEIAARPGPAVLLPREVAEVAADEFVLLDLRPDRLAEAPDLIVGVRDDHDEAPQPVAGAVERDQEGQEGALGVAAWRGDHDPLPDGRLARLLVALFPQGMVDEVDDVRLLGRGLGMQHRLGRPVGIVVRVRLGDEPLPGIDVHQQLDQFRVELGHAVGEVVGQVGAPEQQHVPGARLDPPPLLVEIFVLDSPAPVLGGPRPAQRMIGVVRQIGNANPRWQRRHAPSLGQGRQGRTG